MPNRMVEILREEDDQAHRSLTSSPLHTHAHQKDRLSDHLHHDDDHADLADAVVDTPQPSPCAKENLNSRRVKLSDSHDYDDDDEAFAAALAAPFDLKLEDDKDPIVIAQNVLIGSTKPTTDLEIALTASLKRKEIHIARLTAEITKLQTFISKRKQTYKRKRKDEGAPTRALSAYNIFIQDRFAKLAKENEKALKSDDMDAQLRRVPPANLVASTGNEWKELSAEEKAKYEERAKKDRKRYEEQMAQYQPLDKNSNKKRNKTGYNMFFSAHVLRMKETEDGVPSERGSVARLVGNAWKSLSSEEKAYYEREADRHNGMNTPLKNGEDELEDDEGIKRQHMEQHYMHAPHPEMHMHPVPPPYPGMHPGHDPRAAHHHPYYPPPPMYGQPPPVYGHYDYSQHHQRNPPNRAVQGGYSQAYAHQRNPYEG